MDYAELHCLSNFSFLRGASHPEELVERALALGYRALALTDECSLAGVVRAHQAAAGTRLQLLIGSELHLEDGPSLVLLAMDRCGYGQLSRLITRARRRSPKGHYRLVRDDLDPRHGAALTRCIALWLPSAAPMGGPPSGPDPEPGRWLARCFAGRAWIAAELLGGDDRAQLARLAVLAEQTGLPLVAAGDVHLHHRARRRLQDLLTAVRLGVRVDQAGAALFPNGERCLRDRDQLAARYPAALLRQTLVVAEQCRFSLTQLRYEYPLDAVPAGRTPSQELRRLTTAGAARRWPDGAPARVTRLIEHELALIAELRYEPYFLTVHDIVQFARGRGILCQGRGSAANSAVCYALGITEVDPARMSMLFERFISRERDEPPDIDVDFEHQRREEVIQYLYRRYGRDRAALAATVIRYRGRSAIRDVGRALGIDTAQVEQLAAAWHGRSRDQPLDRDPLLAIGLDPDSRPVRQWLRLVDQLIGFPRHLSQHVGGFVIAAGPLAELVPIENAAMPERTVIQWDKDDLDSLGLLKVDLLALGMLSAVRRSLAMVGAWRGRPLELQQVPAEDPATYAMLRRADTVGVFQVESRAQMAMLPRLAPRRYYDLVIEVAIVRPGPIQGRMVHPYLRRRRGEEPVSYPSDAVRDTLERTLGVPIFQEQVIKLAMVAAGFSAGEADQLRRAIGSWRRHDELRRFEDRLRSGMAERGYHQEFAAQLIDQIRGFGGYGFPESHAAGFALIVYCSAWLKCHHPAAFTAALLNSQPMGFYGPSQLVQDARRHGVEVLPVTVTDSDPECELEGDRAAPPQLRLGLNQVRGLSSAGAAAIAAARRERPFSDVDDLARRAGLNRADLNALADAGALHPLTGHRRLARWQTLGIERLPGLFDAAGAAGADSASPPPPALPEPAEGEDLIDDYRSLGLTLGRHPLALLRAELERRGLRSAATLRDLPHGRYARTGGLVITRQRPASAAGVTFVTLEDETGTSNIVVREALADRRRAALLGARLLGVSGVIERDGPVVHLVARHLEDHSELLGQLPVRARDFR